MKKALVLAGGIPQDKLIKELQARDYYVLLADYNENPVARKYADKYYRKSTLDIDAIRKIAIDEKVDLLLTCCTDQALETVARLCGELRLPCYIDANTGLNVTNKQYMKRMFIENGIPTARYQIVYNADELNGTLSFPLVVKPVDCNSSKGVIRVDNNKDLTVAIKNAVSYSRTNTAIVEEYIDGKEISVDLFVCDGEAQILCVSNTEKLKDKSKFVISKGIYPASADCKIQKKIEEVAQKIVDTFKLNNCPMLIQLLVKDDDIFIIEFSARTGGCIKYHMIELASGVNVIEHTIDAFEGKKVRVAPHFSNKYVVNEFIYCQEGCFNKLEGFEECVQEGKMETVFQLKEQGLMSGIVQSSGDRIAAITIVADSFGDFVKKHNEIAGVIKVLDVEGKDIMRHDLFPIITE